MASPFPPFPQPQDGKVPPTPKWVYWLFAGAVLLSIGATGIERHWPVPAVAAAFGAIGGIALAFLVRCITAWFPSHGPIDEGRNMAAGVKVAGAILLVAAIVAGAVCRSTLAGFAFAAAAVVIGAITVLINLKYNSP